MTKREKVKKYIKENKKEIISDVAWTGLNFCIGCCCYEIGARFGIEAMNKIITKETNRIRASEGGSPVNFRIIRGNMFTGFYIGDKNR